MKFLCLFAIAGVLASACALSEGERIRDIVAAAFTIGKLTLMNQEYSTLTDIAPQNISLPLFQGLFNASKQVIEGFSGVNTKVEAVPNSNRVNIFIQFPYVNYEGDFSIDGVRNKKPIKLTAHASIFLKRLVISLKDVLISETVTSGKKTVQVQAFTLDLDYTVLDVGIRGLPEGETSLEDDLRSYISAVTRFAGRNQKQQTLHEINKILSQFTEWLGSQVTFTHPTNWSV